MVQIKAIKEKFDDNYTAELNFNFDEDSNAIEYIEALTKAMEFETFNKTSIYKALIEVADNLREDIELNYHFLPKEEK